MLAAIVVCGLGYAEGAKLSRRLGGWQVISWALVLSLPDHQFVVWCRPELVQTVSWGGDPRNTEVSSGEGDAVRIIELVHQVAHPVVGAGVEQARVNLSTKRVSVRWKEGALPPLVEIDRLDADAEAHLAAVGIGQVDGRTEDHLVARRQLGHVDDLGHRQLALDLLDTGHATTPVLHALELDHHVDRRGDLLARGLRGQAHCGHRDHVLHEEREGERADRSLLIVNCVVKSGRRRPWLPCQRPAPSWSRYRSVEPRLRTVRWIRSPCRGRRSPGRGAP